MDLPPNFPNEEEIIRITRLAHLVAPRLRELGFGPGIMGVDEMHDFLHGHTMLIVERGPLLRYRFVPVQNKQNNS